MSESTPSAAAPRESVFVKGFLPGLVVGLLIGLAVGAFVPPLLTQEKLPPVDPNAPRHPSTRERDERPPDQPLGPTTEDPNKKPETPAGTTGGAAPKP